MKFQFKINGRTRNAIGVFHNIDTTIEAECIHDAESILRGRFEVNAILESKVIEEIHFIRVKNDTNGNPRYVCHYLSLLSEEDRKAPVWNEDGTRNDKYAKALANAKRIGGRKFHNKQYGGGIVFQSYSLAETVNHINDITGAGYAGYVVE